MSLKKGLLFALLHAAVGGLMALLPFVQQNNEWGALFKPFAVFTALAGAINGALALYNPAARQGRATDGGNRNGNGGRSLSGGGDVSVTAETEVRSGEDREGG